MIELLAQADIAPWAKHGLAGLVIFVLFGVVIWLFKSHSAERKELHKECRDERQEMMNAHHSERKEWHEAQERREARSVEAFKSLEQTIKDNGR